MPCGPWRAKDLYSRTVATVLNDAGVATPAYVYHRTGKFDRSFVIVGQRFACLRVLKLNKE